MTSQSPENSRCSPKELSDVVLEKWILFYQINYFPLERIFFMLKQQHYTLTEIEKA